MFILIRIIVCAVAFYLRWTGRFMRKPNLFEKHRGRRYGVDVTRHKGKFVSMQLTAELGTSFLFKLTRETSVDRLMKALGIAQEVQSGDGKFDASVYVASDHPALHRAVCSRENFRETAQRLISNEYLSIHGDGRYLTLTTKQHEQPSTSDLDQLFCLVDELQAADKEVIKSGFDPFVIRALAVEAALWSLAAYAIGSALEFVFTEEVGALLRPRDILIPGSLTTVAALGLLLGIVIMVLRGSSRSHRVIVESALLLVLSIPILGFQGTKDFNQALDGRAPLELHLEVTRKWAEKRRGRRGRTYYVYHLYFRPLNDEAARLGVKHTRVAGSTFRQAVEGREAIMTVGRGRLNMPWIQSLTFP